MFEHVYKLHGLPKQIVSDRDVLFTSIFWSRLHWLIGSKLRMSSSYHPQTDGATERANRTVTQMIRQCIHPNQKDWVAKLPAIEFAINSARSESTGYAPFFLNFGRMPRSMIWNDAGPGEFPAIREFALQKKLALMAAHDSILTARVKQTRDANKKRQDLPFKTGDLAYLSSKNISFPKGLARKLIPKYLGPYKILKDFGNSSFKLELPHHLKKRGVHDVFHASLLRIHVPNDDRLFPGRMDTQVIGDTWDDEWAVDQIKSHSGAKTDATFEILWKSGDITWLPYYQITHLQALTDYLELLGVKKISKLPTGHGRPPMDDPQVFLGSINPYDPNDPTPLCPTVSDPLPYLNPSSQNVSPLFRSTPHPTFISLPVNLELIFVIMPKLCGVKHPIFHRLSTTHYSIHEPEDSLSRTVHVGQVADYLKFDEQLRSKEGLSQIQSLPLGFSNFASLWNNNRASDDSRRFSEVFIPEGTNEYQVDITTTPVSLVDFFITPEQVGLAGNHDNSATNTLHSEIVEEFAAVMMEQRRNSRRGFEKRQGKRLRPFKRDTDDQPTTALSRLKFKEKLHKSKEKRRKRTSAPARRSPSPAQSATDDGTPEEEFNGIKQAPQVEVPVDVPVEMETGQ